MGSVEELRQHIEELTRKLREEEIYNKSLRQMNNSYWKVIVKYRKKLGEMGMQVNED
jgi:predicted sulfurtransferase